MTIDRGEELLLQRQIFGQRFEDQVGFGNLFGEIVIVGAETDEVGELLRLRHCLRSLEPLPGLLVIAGEKNCLHAVRGEQLAPSGSHRAVGSEHGDSTDLSRRGRHERAPWEYTATR